MTRKKKAAIDVPGSVEEARAIAQDYVTAERDMLGTRLSYERAIDQLKAERDKLLQTYAEGNAERFARLKAWWEAGGKAIAGRGRSAELAGAKLGIRLTPPAVKLQRGLKAEAVIAWLGSIRWSEAKRFLRSGKVTLDKEAIIKACRADEDIATVFEGQGLTVEQVDEFFIDAGIDEEAIEQELAAAG